MKERFRACAAGIWAVVLLVTGHGLAQMQTPMCHTGDTGEVVSPERLPAPERLTGIGTVHFPITNKGEAQAWFEQGINLYEDFWDYEAARAFEQSIRSDPNCAMCYWGLYQAESLRQTETRKYALEALSKAAELSKHATSREKLYIRAAQAHEEGSGKSDSKGTGNSREIEILRTLVKKNPKIRTPAFFWPKRWRTDSTKKENQSQDKRKPRACFRAFCAKSQRTPQPIISSSTLLRPAHILRRPWRAPTS